MRISGRHVILFVAEYFNLEPRDLMGPRRDRKCARPRQVAYYAIKELCDHLSYPMIGRMIGGRDHTTVISGANKIRALMETDPAIAKAVSVVLTHFSSRSTSDPGLFLEARIIAAERHVEALYAYAAGLSSAEHKMAA